MIMKLNQLVIAAAFGVGALAAGNVPANAMPILGQQQTIASEIVTVDYVPPGHMGARMDWQMHRDGNRCRTRFGNCRHFHQGFYYETPWWTLPLVIGSAMSNGNHGGGRHVQWCMSHHQSYNPRTNMWMGHDGRYHQCNASY